MVFVTSLLLVSTLITLSIIFFINTIVFNKKLSTLNFILSLFETIFNKTFINIIYIYILVLCFSIQNKFFIVSGVLLLIFFSYSQKFTWSLIMEEKLTSMKFSIRKISLKKLLNEDCVITQATLLGYMWDLVQSERLGFIEMFEDSIRDIKVVCGLIDPTVGLTENQRNLYNLQRKLFKYKNVEEFFKTINGKSDEEILKLYDLFKQSRDPNIIFNSLRRLPWKFNYTVESSLAFKSLTINTLVLYNFFKTTLVAITLVLVYFIYTIFFFKIQFLKQISVWFVIGMLYFWLMSGFNFFLKRYQYGKFTSQIQRFWKRTNTCFWLIEGFLILLFFYYYLNSSQEPLYMYDYSAINQEYLVSLHTIGTNIILLSLVIYFMYFVLLRLNSNSWTQISLYIVFISIFIFFSFFIETYQFYYVVSSFNERLWVFNEEDNLWVVDIDNPILRTKHQYLLVCLIAKYWHFLFIFLSWVFFLIKSFERKKVTFVLFGANLQNMIILYLLNFACYLQWFKWIYRRFFDLPYTWFFINSDNKFFYKLMSESKLFLFNSLKFDTHVDRFFNIIYRSLVSWSVDSLVIWKFI